MPITIHNNEYYTVAERIKEAGDHLTSVNSEVLAHNPVVVKVTITTDRGTFTGISAANPAKVIEKNSPYEVAETSALGRALGFSRYGLSDQIASAEEMEKVGLVATPTAPKTTVTAKSTNVTTGGVSGVCEVCGAIVKAPYKICYKCRYKQVSTPPKAPPVDIPDLVVGEEFTAF